MTRALPLILLTLTSQGLMAQQSRQLEAHVHGRGALDIAVDGTSVAMAFRAPGADIVGFEYAPESDADRALVAAALDSLASPLSLFILPESAGCSVTRASADLAFDGAEDGAAHGEEHGEEHAEAGHDEDDHAQDDHAHDDDAHDDHAQDEHSHDDHAHDAAEGAGHSEFQAEYALTCSDPAAIDSLTFAYFDAFPNAQAVEVQVVTPTGAQAFEVERAAPSLALGGVF